MKVKLPSLKTTALVGGGVALTAWAIARYGRTRCATTIQTSGWDPFTATEIKQACYVDLSFGDALRRGLKELGLPTLGL